MGVVRRGERSRAHGEVRSGLVLGAVTRSDLRNRRPKGASHDEPARLREEKFSGGSVGSTKTPSPAASSTFIQAVFSGGTVTFREATFSGARAGAGQVRRHFTGGKEPAELYSFAVERHLGPLRHPELFR